MCNKIIKLVLIALLSFSVCACQEVEVSNDLSQKQANEIVATLSEQGISAFAVRGNGSRGNYSVKVPQNRYTEATTILFYEGLPKAEEPSVSDLLSPKGFLPSSREIENMRVDLAIATQLESMLAANPAVNGVKAVVRRPVFDGIGPAPSARVSVVIKKVPSLNLDKETVLALIANMIPGTTVDSVAIDIQDSVALASNQRKGVIRDGDQGKIVSVPFKDFLGIWRVAENDYDRMLLLLLCSVLGILIVGLFIGFSVGFLGRKVVSAKSQENYVAIKSEKLSALPVHPSE